MGKKQQYKYQTRGMDVCVRSRSLLMPLLLYIVTQVAIYKIGRFLLSINLPLPFSRAPTPQRGISHKRQTTPL